MATREQYRIGAWSFDVDGAALIGPEQRRLEDRAARTLGLLCRRRGETVSQAEILSEVWNGRAVSPNSVAVVIADLRRSLGDDARDPRHIVTVAKRGYRLNAEAEDAAGPGLASPVRMPAPGWIAAGIALLVLVIAAFLFLGGGLGDKAGSRVVLIETVRNETGEVKYAPLAAALDALVTDQVTRQAGLVVVREGTGSRPGAGLRLSSRLILWNGQPTLSMSAMDAGSGAVVWTSMAAGPEEALAGHTITALSGLALATGNRAARKEEV
jgi:DNA-binding winged helix-turn-helix (wHTH) protein